MAFVLPLLSFALVKLLGKIILDTHFADSVQLAFQLTDVSGSSPRIPSKTAREALSRLRIGHLDGSVQVLDRLHLQREVAFKLRLSLAVTSVVSLLCQASTCFRMGSKF